MAKMIFPDRTTYEVQSLRLPQNVQLIPLGTLRFSRSHYTSRDQVL